MFIISTIYVSVDKKKYEKFVFRIWFNNLAASNSNSNYEKQMP